MYKNREGKYNPIGENIFWLKKIKVITGYLSIEVVAKNRSVSWPTSFSFLQNLEYIHGRTLDEDYALKVAFISENASVFSPFICKVLFLN